MSLGSRFYRQKGRVTMDENELMGSMKVSKAVAKMAIPSVISSLVTVVYNMAVMIPSKSLLAEMLSGQGIRCRWQQSV